MMVNPIFVTALHRISGKLLAIAKRLPRAPHPILSGLLVWAFITSPVTMAASNTERADQYLSLLMLNLKGSLAISEAPGSHLLSIRSQQLRVPASTLKTITAYLAIKRWGLEHRFSTDFFIEGQQLWIKGSGDPFITSEEIILISNALKTLAKKNPALNKIKTIAVDYQYFPELRLNGRGRSDNPYDAGNAALVVNFNTLNLRKKKGVVYSAEAQTPITPLATTLGKDFPAGKKRISLPGGREMSAEYFGQVFSQIYLEKQVSIVQGSVPKTAKLLYRHQSSKTLQQLLQAMLTYSNNFIANQLFLMLPTDSELQTTLSEEEAQLYFNQQLQQEFGWTDSHFVDGAGLSRQNQISVAQMLQFLHVFKPWIYLLPSRFDGLKAKTGTLSDNHSLAGYLQDDQQRWLPFALLVNKKMPANYRYNLMKTLHQQLQDKGLRSAAAAFSTDSSAQAVPRKSVEIKKVSSKSAEINQTTLKASTARVITPKVIEPMDTSPNKVNNTFKSAVKSAVVRANP